MNAVVKYDIPNRQILTTEDYDFLKDIDSQMEGENLPGYEINFTELSKFGNAFTADASRYVASLKSESDKQRVDRIFKQLYKVYSMKQQTEKQYEAVIFQEGLDALKIEMMKLTFMYDQMPLHLKEYLNLHSPGGDFPGMVLRENQKI